MPNIYRYPEIRDVLMILVDDIKEGDNSDWSILVPRSADALEKLKSFLNMRNVTFFTLPAMDSTDKDTISFSYGQDAEIDETVRQMQNDSNLKSVNNIFLQIRNQAQHEKDKKAVQEAVDELKTLVTKVKEVQYEGEKEPSHYYFYFKNIERARQLMVEMGIWVERHTSHADGNSVEVLRLPIDNVRDLGKKIIEELKNAAEEKSGEELLDDDTKQRLSELKKRIVWAEKSDPKIWRDKSESVVFTFKQDYAAPANYLLDVMGIKVLDIIHAKMVDGDVYIRCAYSKDDPIMNVVYEELRKAAEEKRDKGRTPDEIAKEKALDQLKQMITNVTEIYPSDHVTRKYFYFYFPADKIAEAQELMEKVGVSCEQHVSHYKKQETMVLRYPATMVSANVVKVVGELSKALDARSAQNNFEQDAGKVDDSNLIAHYDPEAEETRKQQANDKEQALNQLKEMIVNTDEVVSGDTHRGYFYLYFPADKVDLADELLQKLDVYAEKHVSHIDGIETTVLRYPSTMVPGYFLQVYGALNEALNARSAQGNFEHGAGKVDDMVALETLKRLIKRIGRLSRKQELANPGKEFYCFYFDKAKLDEAQDLLLQMRIPTEMEQDDEGKQYLLYSVNKGEMPEGIVDEVIDPLYRAAMNKMVDVETQREAALAKLKKIVTDVKHARYKMKPDEYYYFYFPIGRIDEAQELMTRFVGDVPEQHLSHAGMDDERLVLRFLIDDTSAVMGLIEELYRELRTTVKSRAMAQDRGMVM